MIEREQWQEEQESKLNEDDAAGGLEAVLASELEKYGLPAQAGLTGLLRHIRTNDALTIQNYKTALEMSQQRFERNQPERHHWTKVDGEWVCDD